MRNRFYSADALRGIAAIIVVFYHTKLFLAPDSWAPHFSYLAVDFFFALSGFVIAHAYDPRFERGLGVGKFMVSRFARLLPLHWLAIVVSMTAEVLAGHSEVVASAPYSALLLPNPAWGPLFPLNGPAWSLFFEVWVANLIYAVTWRHLKGPVLWAVIGLGAIGVIASEKMLMHLDIGMNWETVGGGVARVAFSFFAGVALARLRARREPSIKVNPVILAAVFTLLLCAPLAERPAHIYELLCVFVAFPALIYLCSAHFGASKIGDALGDTSYAAYVIHCPILVIVMPFLIGPASTSMRLFLTLLCIAAAYGLNLADRPVQAALKARLARKVAARV